MVSISTVARMVPRGSAERVLGGVEDVVPEPRLQMALQLGQVEVRPAAAGEQLAGVVEEVETEVDQAGGDRPPVQQQVLFLEVPPAGTNHERRQLLAQRVALALGALVFEGAPHGVHAVGLAR